MQDQSETFRTTVNDFSQPRTGLPGVLPLITEVLDNAGAQQGALADGDITDARQPVISGKGIPNSLVVIDISGAGGLKFVQVDEHGNWSYTPDTPLADGTHQITVYQADAPDSKSSFVLSVNQEGPVAPVFAGIVDDVGDVTGLLPNGSFTDDRRPTFTGSGATPNGELRIQFGQHVFPINVDSEGHWSWAPPFDMDLGKHFVTIQDLSNGTNSELFTFDIGDGAPAPVTPVIASIFDDVGSSQGGLFNGATTDDLRPTLRGTAAPNAEVSIYDHGVLVFTVTADANGNWSWGSSTDLAAGWHNFQVRSGDQVSNNYTLTLQPETPVLPNPPVIQSGFDNVGMSQGSLVNGATTDDMRPTLQGRAAPNAQVSIYDNGVLVGTAIADRYGNWSWESDTNLAAGTHNFQVNSGDQASNTFVLNLQPGPALPAILSASDDVGSEQGQLANGAMTDDARPMLTGSGEPGSYVVIYDNGRAIGNALVGTDGMWTFTPEGLADGIHSLTVATAQGSSEPFVLNVQGSGYSDKPIVSSVIDNSGTAQGEIANGASTDDTTPTFSGMAKPGSWVEIRDGWRFLGQVQADENGHWSFTPHAELTAGDHTINISNGLGSSSFQLTIDPPAASIVSVHDNVGANQGELTHGASTDDSTPTLTGTGAPNAYVFLYDNGRYLAQVFTDADGRWTYTTDGLSDGQHTFTVKNQYGTSDSFVLNVQGGGHSDKPTIASVIDNAGSAQGELANGAVTDDTTPTFSGMAKPGSWITISDGWRQIGYVQADESGHWTFTPPEGTLAPGEHTFNISNSFGGSSFQLTINPPVASIVSVYDDVGADQGELTNGAWTDDNSPTLTGVGASNSFVNLYDNGRFLAQVTTDADGRWSYTPEGLIDGEHTFTVTNQFGISESFVLNIQAIDNGDGDNGGGDNGDSAQHSIRVILDDAGNEKGPVFDGGVTDDNWPRLVGESSAGGYQLKIYMDGQEIGEVRAPLFGGTWTWDAHSALPPGKHTFTVAGPDGVHSEPFQLEILPPAPSVSSAYDDVGPVQQEFVSNTGMTDDNRPTFSGTGAAGHTVYIYDGWNHAGSPNGGGTLLGKATVLEDGTWSFTPEHPLSDGIHSISVSYTEDGMNQGSPFHFQIDTSGIQAPQSDAQHDDIGALSIGDVLTDEGDALFGQQNDNSEVVTDIAAQVANADAGLGDVTSFVGALAEAHATTSSDLLSQWEVTHATVH